MRRLEPHRRAQSMRWRRIGESIFAVGLTLPSSSLPQPRPLWSADTSLSRPNPRVQTKVESWSWRSSRSRTGRAQGREVCRHSLLLEVNERGRLRVIGWGSGRTVSAVLTKGAGRHRWLQFWLQLVAFMVVRSRARPHFSAATKEKFRQRLEEEVVSLLIISKPSAEWPDTINDFLDEEEKSRLRCVGPRLLGVNEDSGEVAVGPRPELDP